jgi:hypothetical protein
MKAVNYRYVTVKILSCNIKLKMKPGKHQLLFIKYLR